MSKRAHRENSDAGSLFPFLAVLLCTMGSLLVLLVVLAQRAAESSALESIAKTEIVEPTEAPAPTSAIADTEEVAALEQQLKKVLEGQQLLESRRAIAEKRLREEQSRLSHLEDHTRRIEHELARLSIASQQLEATENNQTVDQQQAEGELKHLQSLVEENEERLDDLRKQAKGKRSYAIVPYQGPNGTYRKPIYIECRKDGVYIQPEGLHFTRSDFPNPTWPGNPLAMVLRASREYLIARAAKAGEPEPPDPYPILIVRPDGIGAFLAAREAITSWDSDFGYENISGDWKLDFPDMPDPLLAQVQSHAAMQAREKLAILARAAPRRFRGTSLENIGSLSSEGGSGGGGNGNAGSGDQPNGTDSLANSNNDGSPGGNGLAAGQSEAHYSANSSTGEGSNGPVEFGAMAGGEPGNQANSQQSAYGNSEGLASGGSEETINEGPHGQQSQGSANGSSNNAGSAGGSLAQGSSSPQSGSGSSAGSSSSASSGSSAGAASSSGGSPGSMAASGKQAGAAGSQASPASMSFTNKNSSIAETKGRNWAVKQKQRGAFPIRRPIDVVVRKNQIALLPSQHSDTSAEESGAVVSLNQPMNQISEQFIEALKVRVEQWGLAGNGLYWRPVLELKVGPDAQHTAYEITRLLKDSGVEVRLPEMARAGQGATTNAPR